MRRVARGLAILAMVGASTGSALGQAQTIEDRVYEKARELAGVELAPDHGLMSAPIANVDPTLPVNALRRARDDVEALYGAYPGPERESLQQARDFLVAAWRAYAGGSRDLSHLLRTVDALERAQEALARAAVVTPTVGTRIEPIQRDLSDISRRIAETLLRRARRAGVDPALIDEARRAMATGDLAIVDGDHTGGTGHHGHGIGGLQQTVKFDVDRFEQNIAAALDGQTVGHAFAIVFEGNLVGGGSSQGLARTAADAPQTPQSPTKESHVASVSKTLTAIVIMRLLEENGLTPDEPVAAFLPSDWDPGDGVESLKFRDFMTHRSGFAKNAGNFYDGLRSAIENDVGATGRTYSNSNFGLMRVLAAGLMGIDPAQSAEIESEVLAASAFLIKAEEVFSGVGVNIDCASNDPDPTIQYAFPDSGVSGYPEPDHQLNCGGIGWFISAVELAGVLSNLRNTENLISAASRQAMEDGFLGFGDPVRRSYATGDFGTYYMHGGDWNHGGRQVHACGAAFPIPVEVGLIINSALGAMPYQCNVLGDAFDNAWVAS